MRALRSAARTLRAGVLADLPALLDEWSTRLEALGGHVHWATDGAEATAIVRELVRRRGSPLVAKGKSMARGSTSTRCSRPTAAR